MNKYHSYKSINLSWLKEIPTTWSLVRVKNKFTVTRGRVISKEDLSTDGVYPVYSSQTKNAGVLGYLNTYDFDGELITWTTDGYAGTVFYRTGKFNCTNICGVLNKKENIADVYYPYHAYILGIACIYNRREDITGHKLMANEMKNILYPAPCLTEQKQIADFLDWKVNEIDKLILIESKKIEYLKQLKSSLIFEVVTGKVDVRSIKIPEYSKD